jgi:uncharacterized protein YgiM (DUF1202 family)
VRIWDVATGALLHVLRGHDAWATFAAWSADGRALYSAAWDGTVRVWSVGEVRECAVPQRNINVRAGAGAAFSVLASVTPNNELEIVGRSAGWYEVLLEDGRRGWVAAESVRVMACSQ